MTAISRRVTVAAVLAVGAAIGGASAAQAAQQYIPLSCGGEEVLVRAPGNSALQSWSVGQVVDGGSGHLIPLSFTYSFTPTGGATVTETVNKGGGRANPNQQTVTCTGTFEAPEGVGTISVTAVARP